MPNLQKLALVLPLTLLIPLVAPSASADPATKVSKGSATHVVSDATKRKGEQQHLEELAEAKGQKKLDILSHDEHRRKGEQQHLRELHQSKKAAQTRRLKNDN